MGVRARFHITGPGTIYLFCNRHGLFAQRTPKIARPSSAGKLPAPRYGSPLYTRAAAVPLRMRRKHARAPTGSSPAMGRAGCADHTSHLRQLPPTRGAGQHRRDRSGEPSAPYRGRAPAQPRAIAIKRVRSAQAEPGGPFRQFILSAQKRLACACAQTRPACPGSGRYRAGRTGRSNPGRCGCAAPADRPPAPGTRRERSGSA